jgi:hypothetical protein
MIFTEGKLEKTFIELLGNEGFTPQGLIKE